MANKDDKDDVPRPDHTLPRRHYDPRLSPEAIHEREERARKERERLAELAKSADWPEKDPRTGAPLKTGNPLTDDTPPYGVPKDPVTGVALAHPDPDVLEAQAPEDAVLAPEEPDTATLTAQEQNRWEVLTGERKQKDAEAEEAATKRAEEKRKAADDKRRRGGKPSAPRPDQGLPGGRPVRPEGGPPPQPTPR